MKKTCLVLLFTIFAQTSFADCTVRTWVDPLFSKEVHRTVNRTLRKSGYKILGFRDDFFERYRLVLTFFPKSAVNESFVRFYMQEFHAPNYFDLFKMNEPVSEVDKNDMALELIKDVPECED